MPIENVEQIEQVVEQVPPQEVVEEHVDEVRPDGPGSGRSKLRQQLEKGFEDERQREEKATRRQRTSRAAEQYKEQVSQDQNLELEPEAEAQPELAAPEAFSREARAEWANVPPVVQQAILKREEDTARGVAELKQRYDDIDKALTPRMDLIRRHGHTPGQAVNQLF